MHRQPPVVPLMFHEYCRTPEDGYYSFTFSAREEEDTNFHAAVQRISASDPNDVTVLCQAAQADYRYNTGTCSVSSLIACWPPSRKGPIKKI